MNKNGARGFTLIEIVAVLVIVAILATVLLNRFSGQDYSVSAQASVIRENVRYSQSMAMKRGLMHGIKCDGTYYWVFRTNNPDLPANEVSVPGQSSRKISLASLRVSVPAFTLLFDTSGIPYTAYVDTANNNPVSDANAVTINVDSIPSGTAVLLHITPDTGFVQ